jgi:DNA-binding response OmpR family regulator
MAKPLLCSIVGQRSPRLQTGGGRGGDEGVTRIAPRVLLVEDEGSLVLTLSDRLEAEGYRVEACGDAETALVRAAEAPSDLAILDVMLPGMDGFALCRELRHRGLSLPVLMLTARAEVVDRVVGLKLGADDYLTKPFEMAELLARLEALLRRSRAGSPAADVFVFGGAAPTSAGPW